jgi:hypothetical protein
MKNFSLLVLVLFSSITVLPQNTELNSQIFLKKNSINIELGGYTVIGAVFYERVIINQPKFKAVGQLGYGLSGWPIGIHGLISSNKHHFEFGACITFPSSLIDFDADNPYVTGRLGYRFQKPEGKFIFRAGLMPVVVGASTELGPDFILWVWPGVSFGRAF